PRYDREKSNRPERSRKGRCSSPATSPPRSWPGGALHSVSQAPPGEPVVHGRAAAVHNLSVEAALPVTDCQAALQRGGAVRRLMASSCLWLFPIFSPLHTS